jgi:hypothetical protein
MLSLLNLEPQHRMLEKNLFTLKSESTVTCSPKIRIDMTDVWLPQEEDFEIQDIEGNYLLEPIYGELIDYLLVSGSDWDRQEAGHPIISDLHPSS